MLGTPVARADVPSLCERVRGLLERGDHGHDAGTDEPCSKQAGSEGGNHTSGDEPRPPTASPSAQSIECSPPLRELRLKPLIEQRNLGIQVAGEIDELLLRRGDLGSRQLFRLLSSMRCDLATSPVNGLDRTKDRGIRLDVADRPFGQSRDLPASSDEDGASRVTGSRRISQDCSALATRSAKRPSNAKLAGSPSGDRPTSSLARAKRLRNSSARRDATAASTTRLL